ncbi:MAG: hypothetical protein JSU81_03945 [Candidatus Coatesbacteria bacterium]|nr:MAG: hypothetical protein JSU81_03945 [Candidatus Coatesbacteria bacterium]
MAEEYKSRELQEVWAGLLRVFAQRYSGCTVREVASSIDLSEERVRACLEYLVQDGKVVREGNLYAPDPKYVRDVAIKHAMKKVDTYMRQEKRATVDDIVRDTGILRLWVEEALSYLAGSGRVRYDQRTREWVYLVRGA